MRVMVREVGPGFRHHASLSAFTSFRRGRLAAGSLGRDDTPRLRKAQRIGYDAAGRKRQMAVLQGRDAFHVAIDHRARDRVGRRCRRRDRRRRPELSAAGGQVHPAVRPRRRRRHHRPAARRQAFRALGQAGGGREPPGRRRPRRHQRLHQRQRRPHAAVRSGLDLHGAPLCAREAALRCGARPAADHQRHHHRDCALRSGLPEREIARRVHCARPRQARYAQRVGRRRQFRPDHVGFHQEPGLAGGPGAVPRHPAGADRPGRGPHPPADVLLRDDAAAGAGRKAQGAGGDQPQAGRHRHRHSDRRRGRLPVSRAGQPDRHVRPARHVECAARKHRRRRARRGRGRSDHCDPAGDVRPGHRSARPGRVRRRHQADPRPTRRDRADARDQGSTVATRLPDFADAQSGLLASLAGARAAPISHACRRPCECQIPLGCGRAATGIGRVVCYDGA